MPSRSDTAPGLFDQYAATPVTERSAEGEALSDDIVEVSSEQAVGLLPEARRALVNLLRNGVIRFDSKRKVFESLVQHQQAIQRHLADMYLALLLDEAAGVAILLQQEVNDDGESEGGVSLMSRRPLSVYDTVLLLLLRKHYQERESAGEQQVFVDVDWLEEQLLPFLPLTNSDRRDRSRLNTALNRMKERYILAAVRGEDDRLEVTPVIRYVVNADFLERMLDEYCALLENNAS